MDGKQYEGNAYRQILTALLASIPTLTYGIQIGWLSPMGRLLKSPESPANPPLTSRDVSWMASALPLAAICGVPFFSYCSDRFGRKICIIAMSVLSCISWIIKLTAVTINTLVIARVIAGLAAGGCFVVVPVYIKEIAQDSWRGSLASLTITVCKLGVIFVYGVGMLLSYTGNQIVYLSVAAVHAVVFIFMPESPNYLLKTGREQKAAKTISWLRNMERSDKTLIDEICKLKDEQRTFDEMPKVTLLSVVRDRPTFAALRMVMVLMAMQTLSGCFALVNHAAEVLDSAGLHLSSNTLALCVGVLQLAGSFFTTVTVERFGRKIPLACSSLIVSISMATLATCYVIGGSLGWLTVTSVCTCMIAYGAGLAPVPMVIMAEVFTFQIRAKMAGVSMAFSFFCISMTVIFYSPDYASYVFYVFSAITLLGVAYTVFYVPETKGKSLDQIQKYWRKPEILFV